MQACTEPFKWGDDDIASAGTPYYKMLTIYTLPTIYIYVITIHMCLEAVQAWIYVLYTTNNWTNVFGNNQSKGSI